jgi:hypothetical protein
MQHNTPMVNKTSAIMTLLVWQFVKQIATLTAHMQKLNNHNTMENWWLLPYYKVYIEDKYTPAVTREMRNSLYMTLRVHHPALGSHNK